MKNILKIFTALFMIAPFYGAVADTSEYEECISDIEYEIFSGHKKSAFGDSGSDSLLKNKYTLSEKNKYTLSEAEKTELKKQIKAVADKVLDTPMTESGSVKCNGTPYTINIGDTLRKKIPQACHKYAYAAEQQEVEENFAKNKCQHLKTTATSEENSSSSNPRAGRNDRNRATERESAEPEYLDPSVSSAPSFGNDMKTPPVAPGADEESDDDKITACDEPKYKLKNNECVSTDGDKCDSKDPNATSGKMSNGQCLITECKCGFQIMHAQTTCGPKQLETCTSKDDNADSAQFACNEKGTEYCKIKTCKNGFTPDEKTNKCISSDSAQAKCTNTNLPDGVTEQKWNNSLKRCLHTKCDETNYKLVNSECVPKPCEPKDIEHSKTGEMKGGKCELKTCKTGYEPKNGKCAPTEKTATKDANAKKKELCDKFDKKYGKWDPIKRECKCNDGLKWDDSEGCVEKKEAEIATKKAPVATTTNLDDFYKKYCDNEGYYTDDTFQTPSYADFKDNCKAKKPFIIVSCYKWKNLDQDLSAITEDLKHYCSTETENRVEVGKEKRPRTHVKKDEPSNTTTPTPQDCTPEKIGNGAAEVKWESDKCNIVECDTKEYDQKPVNGQCVKKTSEKYKKAETELNKLMEQAKTALNKIKQKESKEK